MATYRDASGTITLGGTAQQLLPARTGRTGFSVQNLSSGDLYVKINQTAALAIGFKVVAGAILTTPTLPSVMAGLVSIWGATTGQAFEAMEW